MSKSQRKVTPKTGKESDFCPFQAKGSAESLSTGWSQPLTPGSDKNKEASGEEEGVRTRSLDWLDWNTPLYTNFVDLKKVFGSVHLNSLWDSEDVWTSRFWVSGVLVLNLVPFLPDRGFQLLKSLSGLVMLQMFSVGQRSGLQVQFRSWTLL